MPTLEHEFKEQMIDSAKLVGALMSIIDAMHYAAKRGDTEKIDELHELARQYDRDLWNK